MINRHYFISAEKPHGDGSGSYSFQALTMVYRSWLPDSQEVYRQSSLKIEEALKGKPGSNIQIIAFNRI